MKDWYNELNVLDVWRIEHPETKIFTSPKREARLDRVLVTEKLYENFEVETQIVNIIGADHLGIEINIMENESDRRKQPWRLQKWTIESKEFQERIYEEIEKIYKNVNREKLKNEKGEYDKGRIGIIGEYEEGIKMIRRLAYEIQAKLHKKRRREIRKTKQRIERAKEAMRNEANNKNKSNLQKQKRILEWQTQKYRKKNKEEKIEARIEKDEKGNHSFFQKFRGERHYRVAIPKLKKKNGEITRDKEEIAEEIRDFWGKVKNSPDTLPQREEADKEKIEQMMKNTVYKLDEKQMEEIDKEIQVEEVEEAIRRLRLHKAPGRDGIIAELYKEWKEEWAKILTIVFEELRKEGQLTRRLKETSIRLLYKKGDRAEPGNYRPIALLNLDYKILTSVLTYRVRGILQNLMEEDQTAFIRGRHIQETIWRLEAIDKLLKEEDEMAFLISLDQVKAYDRTNWDYMHRVLEKMNFGPKFRQWVQILYTGAYAKIVVNGRETKSFRYGSGVHQGDPLSCALYILTQEPMAEKIRRMEYTGIRVKGKDLGSITQFADDTNVLTTDIDSVGKVLEFMDDEYEKASGAKINRNKSKIIILGKKPEEKELKEIKEKAKLEVENPEKSSRILGIQIFGEDGQKMNEEKIIEKAKRKVTNIGYKANTLGGRVLAIKNQVYSVANYAIQSTKIGQAALRIFQDIANRVLVGKKIEEGEAIKARMRIPREWRRSEKKDGGLGIYDVEEQIVPARVKMVLKLLGQEEKKKPNWTTPIIELTKKATKGISEKLEVLLWKKKDFNKIFKKGILPKVWDEAYNIWMNLEKQDNGEMKRKWTLWSTCFNEEKKNITNNMIKVMKYGARRREDLLNEERKAIILKKIDEDENESKENKINLRRLITRKTKEIQNEDEEKEKNGEILEKVEIKTKNGWRRVNKVTKLEKEKGKKTLKNKDLRKEVVGKEHPAQRYKFAKQVDPKKLKKEYEELKKYLPQKIAGLQEKLNYRELPAGRASTKEQRQCVYCEKYESIAHCIWECEKVKRWWKKQKEVAEMLLGREIDNRDIILGDIGKNNEGKEDIEEKARRIIWASIRLTTINQIWLRRNQEKYRADEQEEEREMLKKIKVEIASIWKHWKRMLEKDCKSKTNQKLNEMVEEIQITMQYPKKRKKKPPDIANKEKVIEKF